MQITIAYSFLDLLTSFAYYYEEFLNIDGFEEIWWKLIAEGILGRIYSEESFNAWSFSLSLGSSSSIEHREVSIIYLEDPL